MRNVRRQGHPDAEETSRRFAVRFVIAYALAEALLLGFVIYRVVLVRP